MTCPSVAESDTRHRVGREARETYRALAALDRAVTFDPQLRELIKIRASQLNGCAAGEVESKG
jgi:alkylhydroperoxidase family enzyme